MDFFIKQNSCQKNEGMNEGCAEQYCKRKELWETQIHEQEGRRRIRVLAKWGIVLGLLNMAVSTGIAIYLFTIY